MRLWRATFPQLARAVALAAGDASVVATDDRNAIRAWKTLRIAFVTSLGILRGQSCTLLS